MSYTRHGFFIPGSVGGDKPTIVTRCGGIGICKQCTDESNLFALLLENKLPKTLESLHHDSETLQKVYDVLVSGGMTNVQAADAISEIQNNGILIRERSGSSIMLVQKYVRKPFYVEAAQVTEGNMAAVAEWCKGEIRIFTQPGLNGKKPSVSKYIHVDVLRPLNDRQSMAFPTDWVLFAGKGYKVYTDKAFKQGFDSASVSSDNSTDYNEEETSAIDLANNHIAVSSPFVVVNGANGV